jgi:hypothetical protein
MKQFNYATKKTDNQWTRKKTVSRAIKGKQKYGLMSISLSIPEEQTWINFDGFIR